MSEDRETSVTVPMSLELRRRIEKFRANLVKEKAVPISLSEVIRRLTDDGIRRGDWPELGTGRKS